MTFRLVDAGWDRELEEALRADHSTVQIVCPFIKWHTAKRLLALGVPEEIQVITRFSLADFGAGVSDTAALRLLLEHGAAIRGVRHLHAKLYLVGSGRVIVTSANLTEAALRRNHEFGFVAEDAEIVAECRTYFSDLWQRAGEDLCPEWLDEWDRLLDHYKGAGAPPHVPAPSEDFGTDLGLAPDRVPATAQGWIGEAEQAFVKFFGQSTRRAARDASVFDEVERSGSHFACTYPLGKRPRSVEDGAIMFLGRLVRDPDDVLIFGRAVGMRHVPGYDDASPADLDRRDWKERWPHYVRVHDAKFVAGSLGNGVSLDELMLELGPDAFASTQRNAQAGTGNVDPRRAYMRQPGVELSAQGMAWLSDRLESAFERHGKLLEDQLSRLDWPQVPEARPEGKP